MGRLATLATLAAAIGAGFAAGHLGLGLAGRGTIAEADTIAAPLSPVARDAAAPDAPAAWPAAFGRFEPAPPAPTEPTPPPEPPQPPFNPTFSLKGVMTDDSQSWAIVEGRDGEFLLRVGDEVEPGVTVASITTEGVTLNTGRGPVTVGFDR